MNITIDQTPRNLAIAFVGGVIILGGLAWIASPKDGQPQKKKVTGRSVFTVEPTSYDFGTVSMAAGVVRKTFTISNPSTTPLELTKLFTSCMCTTATLTTDNGKTFGPFGMQGHGYIPGINASVDAGKTATVEVTFDPAAHGPAGVGHIERVVSLENSGGDPLEIPFSVTVTP